MNDLSKYVNKNGHWLIRISLAIVYTWFGFLKLIDLSPANGLVEELLDVTLPFIPFETFIIILGLAEVLIGLSFIFPKITKIAVGIALLHMVTTFAPTVLLTEVAWQKFLVPTLEGQYILKNFVFIAAMIILFFHKGDKKENKKD